MKSSEEKAIVKDMQLASPEVLRKTAHDVFEEKILGSKLSSKGIGKMGNGGNGDIIGIHQNRNNGDGGNEDIDLQRFDEQDLILGRVVGRGAFCVVKDCSRSFSLLTTTGEQNLSSQSGSRKSGFRLGNFGRHFTRTRKRMNVNNESTASSSSVGSNNHDSINRATRRLTTNNNRDRYVVKQLSPELQRSDKINFLKGTVDLAMETRFLASLKHKNIVCLIGVASDGAFEDGYFIVLEKLNETLGRRVKVWMDMDRQCKGITGVFTGSKKKAQRLKAEQMSAACSLVAGMDFLHEKNIVFRDLVRI
jgi:serine/threonine protein kinase